MASYSKYRSSTRAVTPAKGYATRSKSVLLSDLPSPDLARRGPSSHQYGEEEKLPYKSTVAYTDSSLSFAQELEDQVNRANESSTRPKTRDIFVSNSPVKSQQQRKSPQKSITPPSYVTRSKSKSMSPPTEEEQTEFTLPADGTEYRDRVFNEGHEGGLEIPSDVPGFLDFVHILLSALWGFLYALPVLLSIYGLLTYGPSIWDKIQAFPRADILHTSSPPQPQISVFQPQQEEPKPWQLKEVPEPVPDSNAFMKIFNGRDEMRDEIALLRSKVRLVDERLNRMDSEVTEARRPNFFSPNLGAAIYLDYTTPTHTSGVGFFSRTIRAFGSNIPGPWKALSLPPSQALLPWRENGECWCAASAPNGALSLGVKLHTPIYPSAFILDHIPKKDALDIRSAPKKIEFWAHVPWEWRKKETESWAQKCESEKPKGDGWICLGQMHYNVDDSQHAQALAFDYPSFKIDKAVVRVLENHGKDHTCIYQVKLAGSVNDFDEK